MPEYRSVDSVEAACSALVDDPWNSKVVAGGTALVLMIRQGLVAPTKLVSIARVPALQGIASDGDNLTIGAATTLSEVASSTVVQETAPSLADACSRVANVRIRNVATLGGNLAEADYASDPPAVLMSLGATCRVVGPDRERTLAVADLIAGPYTTTLEPTELITAIVVPTPAVDRRTAYVRFVTRSSEDRPCVVVAAATTVADGVVSSLDIVVGAASPVPQQYPDITARAIGQPLAERVIQAIGAGYAQAIDPLEDLRGSSWYRRQVTPVLVARALRALHGNQ